MRSQFYTIKQLESLNRLGDVMIPRSQDFPSFSDVGCVAYIDEVMKPAKLQDIQDFGLLLTVLRFLPKFMLAGLVKLATRANALPEVIAPLFRQLDIGLRGVVYTLYYANVTLDGYTGKTAHDAIDFYVSCQPDE